MFERLVDLVGVEAEQVAPLEIRDASLGYETADVMVQSPAAPAADLADQLARVADLHRSGVLTDEEFADAKRQIIGGNS